MPALHPAILAHIRSLSADDFLAAVDAIDDPEIRDEALRYRFAHDRGAFLKYCFPAYFRDPFNLYHLDVLSREWIPWRERERRKMIIREADAAPRGFAKSTLAKGELAWAFVHDYEAMAVTISNEQSLAVEISGDVRGMFADPSEEFEALYGPFVVEGGVEKWAVTFKDGRTCRCRAKSMGSQLRGLSRGGVRPTLVLLDDAERSDRVRSPKQRRDWWNTLYEDVLKLGQKRGGLFCRLRGTVLHPDSGLANLLKPETEGWRATRYQACPSYNDNTGDPEWAALWAECGEIYKNLLNGNATARAELARAFFELNREVMERGVVMLDADGMDIFDFHLRIWDEGLKSVLQELQNEPRAAGTKFFEVERFARCRVVGTKATGGHIETADGRRVPLDDVRTFARLDPIPGDELGTMGAEGGAGAGDYGCIVVLGRDKHGFGYVLDVWLRRARDSEQLAALWALCEKWLVEKATIEGNGFQRLLGREFRRQQEERRAAGAYWAVATDSDPSTQNKVERIASLEGPLTAKWLQFAEGVPELLFAQFDAFPDGDHDDGPDAVEGAWRLSNTVRVGMIDRPFRTG